MTLVVKLYLLFVLLERFPYLGVKHIEGFPGSAVVKSLLDNAEDSRHTSSILGSGRSPEKEMTTHSSILIGKSMDREAWWAWGRKDLDTTECAHNCAQVHEINHSFTHMNSCELVAEKTSKSQ